MDARGPAYAQKGGVCSTNLFSEPEAPRLIPRMCSQFIASRKDVARHKQAGASRSKRNPAWHHGWFCSFCHARIYLARSPIPEASFRGTGETVPIRHDPKSFKGALSMSQRSGSNADEAPAMRSLQRSLHSCCCSDLLRRMPAAPLPDASCNCGLLCNTSLPWAQRIAKSNGKREIGEGWPKCVLCKGTLLL